MRVLICGDRNWDDQKTVDQTLRELEVELNGDGDRIEVVIEGGQVSYDGNRRYGGDYQGKVAAMKMGIPVMEFVANWEYFKKAAGPIRNQWQLDFGEPEMVLAFHSDIENSKGTKDMVKRAKKAGVRVRIIR